MGAEKGFFSMDALFAVTLLLLVSASFLNAFEGRRQAAELMGARLEAKLVGEKLAAAINTVYANGPNFELRVNLPGSIRNCAYRIAFDNSVRRISVENSFWGSVAVGVVCKEVRNFVLGPENLRRTILVYWAENQVMVSG